MTCNNGVLLTFNNSVLLNCNNGVSLTWNSGVLLNCNNDVSLTCINGVSLTCNITVYRWLVITVYRWLAITVYRRIVITVYCWILLNIMNLCLKHDRYSITLYQVSYHKEGGHGHTYDKKWSGEAKNVMIGIMIKMTIFGILTV